MSMSVPADGRISATASARRRSVISPVHIGRFVLLLVLLGSWQAAVSTQFLDPFFISSPAAIAVRLYHLAMSGQLLSDFSITAFETFFGFVTGAVLGIAAGMLLSSGRLMAEILDPFIVVLYALPRVALAPLFIVWFGIGLSSKVAVAASLVFFLCLFSTYSGMRQTDNNLLLAVKSLGGTRWQIISKVRVPYAIPWIVAGLKTSFGMALIGAIIGEFIASSSGLGWYISYSGGVFDTTGVMAGLVVLSVLSVLVNSGIKRIETRLLNWKPDIVV